MKTFLSGSQCLLWYQYVFIIIIYFKSFIRWVIIIRWVIYSSSHLLQIYYSLSYLQQIIHSSYCSVLVYTENVKTDISPTVPCILQGIKSVYNEKWRRSSTASFISQINMEYKRPYSWLTVGQQLPYHNYVLSEP